MPNDNANRTDAALLGMCYRCLNSADPRLPLQTAGINACWFREYPNVFANQLQRRPPGFDYPA